MIPGVIILVFSEIIGVVIYIVPVIVSLLFVLYCKDRIIINRGEPMPKEVMIQESKLLAYFAYNSASEIKDYNIFIIKILFLLCMIGIGAYLTETGIRLPYLLKRRKRRK